MPYQSLSYPLRFLKKKKNDTILSLFESLMESLLSCARYICVYIYIYIYIFISATHVFSLVLSPTQLLSFLLFRLLLSPLRLRTQSLISHQPPSFFFQTLIPLNKHQCFPLNLKILGSHLTIFLFFFALSHIMFLPKPNPAK